MSRSSMTNDFHSAKNASTDSLVTTNHLICASKDHSINSMKEKEKSKKIRNARNLVYLSGICASLISVLLGYDVGIMAEAIIYMRRSLRFTTFESNLIIGCLNLVAAVGGFAAGKSSDLFGRNRAIGLACVIFLIGAAIMTFSNSFDMMLVGRVVTGLGVGSGFVVGPIYVSEITPAEIRGMMVALTDVSINVGILLGFVVGLICKNKIENDDAKWRAMIGIGMVPPFIIIILLFFLPESPRWLLLKRKDEDGKKVLLAITGSQKIADSEYEVIQNSLREEEDVTTSWLEVIWPKHRHIMIPVVLSLTLGLIQQISGTEALIYYSPEILDTAGIPLDGDLNGYFIVILGICKVTGEVITMFSVDRFGRKPFFHISAWGITFSMFIISLGFFHPNENAVAFGLCSAMFFFSVGMGALTFVVASELNPLSVRGKVVALTTFVNRFTSGIVALLFNTLITAFSYPGYFLFYAFLSFFSTFFFIFFLPETGGKELEEITQLFDSKSRKHLHNTTVSSNTRLSNIPASEIEVDNVLHYATAYSSN